VSDKASFEVLEAKMAIEIRPRTVTKARAVTRLMSVAPFAGRTPVFVGDDLTDNDGFRAAEKLGGRGLAVLDHFAGKPSEVRRWLESMTAG
jgi:trehalose 6-phosphate phosphatase